MDISLRYLPLKISQEESLLFPFTIVKVKRRPPNKLTRTGRCAAILQTSNPSNYERGGRLRALSRRNTVYCLSLRRIQRSNIGKLESTCCPRMTLKSLSNYKSSAVTNNKVFLVSHLKFTFSSGLLKL